MKIEMIITKRGDIISLRMSMLLKHLQMQKKYQFLQFVKKTNFSKNSKPQLNLKRGFRDKEYSFESNLLKIQINLILVILI